MSSRVDTILKSGSHLGLERVREFAKLLGNPEKNLKIIHVAGTNGKGSTSNMIAGVLKAEGYKVGIFNSPYLSAPIEYFNVNKRLISEAGFERLTGKLAGLVEKHLGRELSEAPTEFEFYTCAALKYFADKKCDFVVLEVGMGGLEDATNFIGTPELCVITNLGIDHEAWLGGSLKSIAEKKAGIIKSGANVVCYPAEPEAKGVLEEKAKQEEAELVFADFSRLSVQALAKSGITNVVNYTTANGRKYQVKLHTPALYQTRNAAVALEAIEALKKRQISISEKSVCKGFEAFALPARFEIISRKPLIVADGGHNPQCISNAVESLKLLTKGKKVVVLTAVMRDKDYKNMYDCINEVASEYVAVSTGTERALTTVELKAVLAGYGKPVSEAKSPAEGVTKARAKLGSEDCLFITGTLYMMNEIRNTICK